MPQITVDYSAELDDAFDRRGFAQALHPLVVETVDREDRRPARPVPPGRRVRRRPDAGSRRRDRAHLDRPAARPHRGDQGTAHRVRTGTAAAHIKPIDGLALHASAEIRDLDPSYRKR